MNDNDEADPKVPGQICAPIPGVVSSVAVELNQPVKKGDRLLVMEAMKMQSTVYAPVSGKMTQVHVHPGQQVEAKDLLLVMAGKGITIFLTSHILEVVERLVHSFAVIRHGEVVCSHTMKEITGAGQTLEDVYFQHVERRGVEEFEWIG